MNIKQNIGISPVLTEYEISSDKLPSSFDGFKIAHISDLHSKPNPEILDLVIGSAPDIICVTGDLLHDDGKSTDEVDRFIKVCGSVASTYMITGNHDLWRFDGKKNLKSYEKYGAFLLEDESKKICKASDFIVLHGVNDPFSRVPKIIKKNVNTALSRISIEDGFNILMFHRANLFDLIKDCGFDLILSGHMHGGQLRLPLAGGMMAPTSSVLSGHMLFPKYSGGKFVYDNTTMLVNCGASNTLVIPRLFNPPEVCLITLKR